MWTTENTEGFNQADIDMINGVIGRLLPDAAGIDQSNIDDAINNTWVEGIVAADLEAGARKRLGI